jgi:hypothetical protein
MPRYIDPDHLAIFPLNTCRLLRSTCSPSVQRVLQVLQDKANKNTGTSQSKEKGAVERLPGGVNGVKRWPMPAPRRSSGHERQEAASRHARRLPRPRQEAPAQARRARRPPALLQTPPPRGAGPLGADVHVLAVVPVHGPGRRGGPPAPA